MKKASLIHFRNNFFTAVSLTAVLLTATAFPISGEELEELSFLNQDIRDVLDVIGTAGGMTISADETVEGRTSFRSPGMDAHEALNLFLKENRLYGSWDNDILYVSRIRIVPSENGRLNLDAEDARLQDIVLALSRNIPETLLFDALPSERLSFHADGQSASDLISFIIHKYPDYTLETKEGLLYIRLKRAVSGNRNRSAAGNVEKEGDLYSLNVRNVRFGDVLDELFSLADKEYSFLGRNDGVISKLNFRPRPFDDTLRLLLEQGNADSILVGDIRYIFDIQRSDVLRKYDCIIHRPLEHLDAKSVSSLLPQGLLGRSSMTIDKERNALILRGSLEDLAPIQSFLDTMDVTPADKSWIRFDLEFLDASNLPSILPDNLAHLPMKNLPEDSGILVLAGEDQSRRFAAWLKTVDRVREGIPITLRYITSEELTANLPPAFDERDISRTQNPNLIFFNGGPDKLRAFREALDAMDRPIPQIRYDLLVIQYQDSRQWDWESDASFQPGGSSDGTAIVGNLSPLLNLNFDIASAFGYRFAVGLSAEISESRAKVIADSTLNGLSGEKISFRNTNTFRYQDIQQDANGNLILSTEKEITSGLFINIEGRVSGDGMITMAVETTISKQLSANEDSGGLPPTSEKIINTRIRAAEGTPVVIGGLTQREKTETETRVPLLGKIPLLGYLFRKENSTMENTEFVVYIVPHIEYDRDDSSDEGGLFRHVYEKYIER